MGDIDSTHKIVKTYLAAVTSETFFFDNKRFDPKPLHVSPDLVRGLDCPSGCGGCCKPYTMDWLPDEERPDNEHVRVRVINLNGRAFLIFSDEQQGNTDYYCRYLRKEDGRCGIHTVNAMTCDFELIRILKFEDFYRMTSKLFGRGWAMLRIDGERGAKCSMLPPNEDTVADVRRKLLRLKEWTDYLKVGTRLPAVIEWIDAEGYMKGPLKL